jgi:hypothetical protein
MEEKPTDRTYPEQQSPVEQDNQTSSPEPDHREESDESNQTQREKSLALLGTERDLQQLIEEEEKTASTTPAWPEEQPVSTTLQGTGEQTQDKEEDPDMSYPGDYHYSRMSSGQSDRQIEMSRSSTTSSGSSSNASTPRQGSEPARGSDSKKDDRSGSGGSSRGGGSSGGSGGSRSKLVAGVFVRY